MEELRAAHGVGQGVGDRARLARDAGRGEGARPVHRRERDPRRLLHARPSASSTRCAPARSCASAGSSRARSRCSRTPRCSASTSSTAACARVRTTGGDIETDIVVIACGVWSPKLARMAGASIPLTPAVHQMIDIGPMPRFAGTKGDIEYPIVRDMDTNMYERQDGTGLEIGSYAHRADPARPRGPPLGRGGRALADRVPVHPGGLHARRWSRRSS